MELLTSGVGIECSWSLWGESEFFWAPCRLLELMMFSTEKGELNWLVDWAVAIFVEKKCLLISFLMGRKSTDEDCVLWFVDDVRLSPAVIY